MASKKRKTLQIQRPDPHNPKSKKKTLPKVNVDDSSATSAIDTDELSAIGPKTAKVKQPNVNDPHNKKGGSATRIQLPDEDKIRKARRATSTQDLQDSDALPSAEQIAHAQKSATLPIMIDTEDIQDSDEVNLGSQENENAADNTMQIDADALATGNIEKALVEADQNSKPMNDQTMQIDADSLDTGDVGQTLEEVKAQDAKNTSDQTMKIDADSLVTGDVGAQLTEVDEEASPDHTMKIDADSLATGNIEEHLNEADKESKNISDQTMKIDADSLSTGEIDLVEHNEKLSMETMQMDPIDLDTDLSEPHNEEAFNAATMKMATQEMEAQPEGDQSKAGDTELSVDKMKETLNAQTMEMDPNQLANELNTPSSSSNIDDDNLDQTMDLTAERPKTIMIKRPSREAGSSTPTVKAVRPDAATVRTARPVTASPGQAKEGTSRIDIPQGEESSREGKTIKLRRPAGAGSRPSTVSRVATGAGLTMAADGTYSAGPKVEEQLGAGWLAVAVLTFLVSLGTVWSIYAVNEPQLPMPGRIVDMNNTVLPYQP
jgi:hypothetical protein